MRALGPIGADTLAEVVDFALLLRHTDGKWPCELHFLQIAYLAGHLGRG